MTALVLGGGGPVGASWMSALLNGLIEAGVPLDSEVVLGTSAGSVVGAWLTMQPEGLADVPALMSKRAAWHSGNASAGRQNTGAFTRMMETGRAAAVATPPISVDQADELWKPMLPEGDWPTRLRMTSVNAATREARAWSAQDGIPLTVGVACSTAAPGIAPPVEVNGEIWLDGGVRSGTNADLVTGDALVVAPIASEGLAREEALLVERGYRVRTIVAERFYNSPVDLIDPRLIDVGAAAGADQARGLASSLLSWRNP
ncbi:patatin-like phospholipase family protein [Lentzea sp. NPDC051838]|uniref:patatin-like phospholipase family protein n=1 Tax=Lentzea sp. NPDC051838 TaxID=3154849 RepID=UPI00342DBB1D